jgi:cobalamin-dependent methionine synthase I
VQWLLDALLAEAPSLLEPRGAGERFALADAAAVQLPLPGAEGSLSGFALGLVTIGPRLEERTAAALSGGDATGALLLDAVGSAAVEAAADTLASSLARTGGGKAGELDEAGGVDQAGDVDQAGGVDDGRGSPCRISPGYGDWPLTAQAAIFARLPHDAIGVRLLPSMLMVPQKSVTFALWFDPAGRVIAGRGGCSRCNLEPCPRHPSPQRGDPA